MRRSKDSDNRELHTDDDDFGLCLMSFNLIDTSIVLNKCMCIYFLVE